MKKITSIFFVVAFATSMAFAQDAPKKDAKKEAAPAKKEAAPAKKKEAKKADAPAKKDEAKPKNN
jgi:hypothetical protein